MAINKPLALVILDGWGVSNQVAGNAIVEAKKPYFDQLLMEYPHSTLKASGQEVGLPEGQMGNSEVGHLNIGAGRIVYQELTRISKSIKDGDFFSNEVLLQAMVKAKENNSALHLLGLLSDGGVHSHITHLYALLEMAKKEGLTKVYVHCFLDGRDVPPKNAKEYIQALEVKMQELGVGKIATVMGRYYAMDRDKRWERVEKAYDAITIGKGHQATLALGAVEQAYHREETDEFVEPSVIKDSAGNPLTAVKDGDAVIFYNFRPDRAREITRAFVDEDFDGFVRKYWAKDILFVCMTQYDKTIKAPIAYKPQVLANTLGEVISKSGLQQLRIAETEKYAHVTFFFNGGVEAPNAGEDRKLIASPKVATYDLKPEMSAYEVTDALLAEIKNDKYNLIVLNYANPDMVGHTGVEGAAIKAIQTVDQCLNKIVPAILAKGGVVLITADHGNAEQMIDVQTHQPHTAHSLNEVPFILIGENFKGRQVSGGKLEDIAPTILQILGIEVPAEMTGHSLLIN